MAAAPSRPRRPGTANGRSTRPTCFCKRRRVLWHRLGSRIKQQLAVDGQVVEQVEHAALGGRVAAQQRLLQSTEAAGAALGGRGAQQRRHPARGSCPTGALSAIATAPFHAAWAQRASDRKLPCIKYVIRRSCPTLTLATCQPAAQHPPGAASERGGRRRVRLPTHTGPSRA